MTSDELIAGIEALIAEYRTPPPPPPPPPEPEIVTVPAGGDIQAALIAGLPVHLEPGAEYVGGVTLPSGAVLYGHGATIRGVGKPALDVAPGTVGVSVSDLVALSDAREAVVLLGHNSATTQGTLEAVPRQILLARVTVPTHRGKAAFAVHATDVLLIDCEARDVYDPGLADSKGIWIHNTPGNVRVTAGYFEAGSENIMIGGDAVKIPGNTPADITIDGATLQKPLSWRTDGINRAVKNLCEIKAGRRVALRNCTLDGSWTASQTGWAIVITPKNANVIEDVLVEHTTIRNAGGVVQLLGLDYNTVTPAATRGIVFRDVSFEVSKSFGAYGCVAVMTGGMRDVTFDQCVGTFDGSQIVISDSSATYGQQGPLTIVNCTMPTGQYGLKADGSNYGDPLPAGSVYTGQELLIGTIAGNTFSGAPSRFKTNFPENVWV